MMDQRAELLLFILWRCLQRNQGEAGAGGSIFNPRGQTIKYFAWGLGNKTNNEAEWMALFQGLEMLDKRTISNMLVFGDSRHVILKMKTCYFSGSIKCRRLHNRIKQLPLPASIAYYHILRENNAKADSLENRGASLPQGSILLNDEEVSIKNIP